LAIICYASGMFEKIATRTAKILYALVIGTGVIWLAWLCLASLPLWAAVVVFGLASPLLAMVAVPVAAGGALLVGLAVGLVAAVTDSLARRVRHGG
jgi:hypothetical protein